MSKEYEDSFLFKVFNYLIAGTHPFSKDRLEKLERLKQSEQNL